MNTAAKIGVYLSTLALFCVPAVFDVQAKTSQATLVFAVDMPQIGNPTLGNYPALASLLADYRKQSQPTYFIFGGGSLAPSPMSTFDRGSHIIDILNSLEPDVMAARKREFSYFEDELSLRAYEAAFPIVISNLFDPLTQGNLEGLFSSAMLEKGGQKIGFLSVVDESVVEEYLLQRVKVFEPRDVITKLAGELRQQGAEIVILAYLEREDYFTEFLLDGTIDMALRTPPPSISDAQLETLEQLEEINDWTVMENGQVLVFTLSWQKNVAKSLRVKTEHILLKDTSKDQMVAMQVEGYTTRLDRLLSQRIGTLLPAMDTFTDTVRTQESAFGNFIADTIKNFTEADIALINGGVIRGEKYYSANTPLTRRDIAEELPFRSRVAMIKLSGQALWDGLENGLSKIEETKGRFPQVSGIQASYKPSNTSGKRLLKVSINGQTLDPKKLYTLATSDYLASGGDGYETFSSAEQINFSHRVPPLISDTVISAIRTQKEISPLIQDRLVKIVK
jgi:2',3'-cyclic-nucleotide 2'-phosphodiesterase (5'-nucleotidase family)